MSKVAVKIAVWEFERGWGSKIDDWMVCQSVEDALKFKQEFNSKNTEDSAPDWYMICRDEPVAIDLTDKQYDELVKQNRTWLSYLKTIE